MDPAIHPNRSRLARATAAACLGALAALALPPLYWTPLVVLAFSGLLWLLDHSPSRRAALAAGWSFGFGYFVAGLYWIGNSFFVDADRFGLLAVPAVIGLCAFLSIFPALACAATWAISRPGPSRVLALAGCWTAAEWLRGTVLTGFPWNLVGYVWTVSDETLQLASIIGIYGLSLVTVALAALPALSFTVHREKVGRLPPLLLAANAALALWVGGELRLDAATTENVPGVQLRLVQANIPQAMKWLPSERESILSRYLALSETPAAVPPTHIVWPETAVPFLLAEEPEARRRIASTVPGDGALLTGIVRRVPGQGERTEHFNSLVAIDPAGRIDATYDKVHLVPFGEYMPLRRILPFDKITAGNVDFSAGDGPQTLTVEGLPPFRPLICYEAIFPGEVPADGARPEWLLNVTNDAWFGDSPGPYQHFQMARVRAVEQGTPLVRAANTGISGVIDAYGRVRTSLPLNIGGVLDAPLPEALNGRTVYAQYGDTLPLTLAALAISAAALDKRRSRRREP